MPPKPSRFKRSRPAPAPPRRSPTNNKKPGVAHAKKTAPAGNKKSAALSGLRGEMDGVDKEVVKRLNEIASRFGDLVTVLNRRAEIALRIGRVKEQQGIEVWSPAREEEVLAKALAASKGPLPPETIRLIFRELMSGSRSLQQTLRVAFLGPKYSYSHLAAVAKFGAAVEHVPVGSIAAVFEEVNRHRVQFGIVPLENSTDGRIADTLDMFARHLGLLKIRAEVRLRVHHCLLAKGEWGQIQRVYSKPQALSQCRTWLGKNLPLAKLHEVISTAAAAELAQREEIGAAVASRAAAEAYGLNVLAANIEDQPHNSTRFAVISEHSEERTGHDKTTLMLRLPNKAGALSKALDAFEKFNVNMTWIESFPFTEGAPEKDPTYLFFVDVEGHANDKTVQGAIEAVRKRCERLEILGSYPRSDCIEN
jgi:chorismate mutase / prephenate dehydratase